MTRRVLAHLGLMIAGVAVFLAGVTWMVFTLIRTWQLESNGDVTGSTAIGIVLCAIAGYCFAVGGSTLFRNVRSHARTITE